MPILCYSCPKGHICLGKSRPMKPGLLSVLELICPKFKSMEAGKQNRLFVFSRYCFSTLKSALRELNIQKLVIPVFRPWDHSSLRALFFFAFVYMYILFVMSSLLILDTEKHLWSCEKDFIPLYICKFFSNSIYFCFALKTLLVKILYFLCKKKTIQPLYN